MSALNYSGYLYCCWKWSVLSHPSKWLPELASIVWMVNSQTILEKLLSLLILHSCLLFSLTGSYISQCLTASLNSLQQMDSLSPFLLQTLLCVHFAHSFSFCLSRAEEASPFCPSWLRFFPVSDNFVLALREQSAAGDPLDTKCSSRKRQDRSRGITLKHKALFCRKLSKRTQTHFCPAESGKKKPRWDGKQSPRGATRGILTSTVLKSALAGNTVKPAQISVTQNFSSSADHGLNGKYEYHLSNENLKNKSLC